jgi:beta-phosphoglucomutase-like phosphatase (HAD superfamily)
MLRSIKFDTKLASYIRPTVRLNKRTHLKPKFSEYEEQIDSSFLSPLQRLEELGTRRFGVIFEFEGVLVADCCFLSECEDWRQLALEEGLEQPVQYQLQSAFRRKPEQVISQIFNWGTDPQRVKYLASRKSQLFYEKVEGTSCNKAVVKFLQMLDGFKIPCAVYSSQLSGEELKKLLHVLSIYDFFDRDDNLPSYLAASAVFGRDCATYGLPDTELFLQAAYVLARSPLKCIVISDNHLTIEATSDLNMKCVIVKDSPRPWELCNANMVVSSLQQLSFRNLQNIFSLDVQEK